MSSIAIYGKGGIGKSTVSSNISYSLSKKGRKVTQIGCDPKHDSTVSLIGDRKQPTILDYLSRTEPDRRCLSDIMVDGVNGIRCLEIGGPEPGIGCAGRGILSSFDALDRLGLFDLETDTVLYDVLGDVVCGGFAVPMRKDRTDAVFIVTSGEFMSIYAANNIMRGLLNFEPSRPRVAGIILNRRGTDGESERVRRFAESVGVPIVADIPRSPDFKTASTMGKTVSESIPESDVSRIFSDIADLVIGLDSGTTPLYLPHPLSDAEIDGFGKGESVLLGHYVPVKPRCDNAMSFGLCSSIGAAYECGRIKDIPIIIHGPSSCGFIMYQTLDRHLFTEIVNNPTCKVTRINEMFCTDITDSDSVFGGHLKLLDCLENLKRSGEDKAIIVTTCVTGMIGDDIDHTVSDFMKDNPGFLALTVHADGNHTGFAEDGRSLVIDRYLSLIDPNVEPTELALNLVDSSFMSFNNGRNSAWFDSLLEIIGIGVGVRLFDDSTYESVRNAKRNTLNILVQDTPLNRSMQRRLESIGMEFLPIRLPQGYRQTLEWIDAVAEHIGKKGFFDEGRHAIEREYTEGIARYRELLGGKTTDIVAYQSFEVDWLVESLCDCGIEVRRIYVIPMRNVNRFHTGLEGRFEFIMDLDYKSIMERISSDPPDFVSNVSPYDINTVCKAVSFERENMTYKAPLSFLERAANALSSVDKGGWKRWRCL